MLVNVTLASNRADGAVVDSRAGTNGPSLVGGGLSNTNATLIVRGSIIANSANGGDVWGTINDAGYNLCSDNTANLSAVGSRNNVDPQLGPLSDNGGPTKTMALLAGSPARDVIPSGFPPTDQRGVSRPQGPAADIGAFEAEYPGQSPKPMLAIARPGTNVTITFTAQAGRSYRLLSSTDLKTWSPVATNSSATTVLMQFAQPMTGGPQSFYQVVTP